MSDQNTSQLERQLSRLATWSDYAKKISFVAIPVTVLLVTIVYFLAGLALKTSSSWLSEQVDEAFATETELHDHAKKQKLEMQKLRDEVDAAKRELFSMTADISTQLSTELEKQNSRLKNAENAIGRVDYLIEKKIRDNDTSLVHDTANNRWITNAIDVQNFQHGHLQFRIRKRGKYNASYSVKTLIDDFEIAHTRTYEEGRTYQINIEKFLKGRRNDTVVSNPAPFRVQFVIPENEYTATLQRNRDWWGNGEGKPPAAIEIHATIIIRKT